MRLLLDINVVLDVALNRAPFVQDSALLLNAVDQGRAEGFVAAHTITTAFYVTAKTRGVQVATAAISKLLGIVDVVPADRADLLRAISLGWRDFEDAVQAVSAERSPRTQSSRAIQRISKALRSRCVLRLRCWRSFDHAAAME